jgi:hypothetical protein
LAAFLELNLVGTKLNWKEYDDTEPKPRDIISAMKTLLPVLTI